MIDFNVESVPEELRERDQWLLWDADSDTPRRPHWRGDFYISWSEPSAWHSFEDAAEAARETDSWGIGYVFAAENTHYDGGKYGFLDLDNCLREAHTEKLKDWVPTLAEFVDGYIEYSGGEHGLHIPFEGTVPDWWSNDVDDEGHEGPEAHTNKFCAITGDVTESSTPEGGVVCDDIAPFLLAAHKEWHGEYPDQTPSTGGGKSGDSDGGEHEEWLTDDHAEEALDHIDPDLPMEEWWNIGRAIQDYDDGPNGKRLYTEWSKDGTKWDDQASGLIDWLWDTSDTGTKTKTATLVYQAKQGGWDPPGPNGATTDGSEYVNDEENGEERELPTPDEFSVNNGGYGNWKHSDDGDSWWKGFSNFQLETNSFATDPDEPNKKRIDLTVHPRKGEAYDVVVEPTVFNEKRDFKSNVVIGLTTTFSGGELALNQLKTFVGTQDAPIRTGTYQMGRFGDEWVTPDGVLATDGWRDDPEHIHVARDIGAERKWELSPEDGDEYDDGEARKVLELLPQTRDSQRFIPALGWFYATAFKPLIHEWTGQFNLLGVLGETGAGKSATLSALWEAFGMEGDPMTADDTKYVLMTTLASTNSIPMWFDEYKPSDMSEYKVDTFWNEVRKTTRGGVSSRGNADGSTDEFQLDAPVVVSGEERVHGSAEERRGIYTTFKKSPTDAGSESARAFAELVGGSAKTNGEREYFDGYELADHARAYYQYALGLDNEEVRDAWRAAAKHVSQLLADHDIEGLEGLVEQGLQTIKFGATVYRGFADSVGSDGVLTDDEIDDAILYIATNAIGGANRKSHLDVLFEVAARAARHGYLEEGTHYKFVREGQADEELRLNLTTGFDKIARYAREHDVAEDLLNSKDDYHERIGDAKGADGGYIGSHSIPTSPIGRAVGVYVQHATDAIEGFEKGMFAEESNEQREAGVEDRLERERATEPKPQPIGDLESGYQTVTVECVSRTTDTPDMFDEMGVLRDATGTVDYVVWARAEPVDLEEGGTYRIKAAKGGTDPDGAPQIELDGRTAEIEPIGRGVGYLDMADSGENQQLGAATDGGGTDYSQAKPHMKELLKEHGPCSTGEWMSKAQEAGIELDAADEALESLKKQGHVARIDDEWEVV